jgi:hypothetical protein
MDHITDEYYHIAKTLLMYGGWLIPVLVELVEPPQDYHMAIDNDRWMIIWLVVWNIVYFSLCFHILGISSSQLALTPSFFRGVGWNHQPDTYINHH